MRKPEDVAAWLRSEQEQRDARYRTPFASCRRACRSARGRWFAACSWCRPRHGGSTVAPPTTMTTTRPSKRRSSTASCAASAAPTWKTRGIDYRERSPLVVPPKLDLPPPDPRQPKPRAELAEGSRRSAPQGRDAAARRRKQGSAGRRPPLMPSELAQKAHRTRQRRRSSEPATRRAPVDAGPSQLGLTAVCSSIFERQQDGDRAVHGRADARLPDQAADRLSDASSSFAYGTGPKNR